jgi:hypothetical protein
MNQPEPVADAMRDGSRYASVPTPQSVAGCLVCGASLTDARARFCSPAHRQLAYRLRRRELHQSDTAHLRQQLRREQRLTAHTVYECPQCQDRFVGERRCPECHPFCRSLGLGGSCPECDQPILLTDLLE